MATDNFTENDYENTLIALLSGELIVNEVDIIVI